MVKIRESHELSEDGSINLEAWFKRLPKRFSEDKLIVIRQGCELSRQYGETQMTEMGESCFRQGLVMAEILSELNLDEYTLSAAIVFPTHQHTSTGLTIESITKHLGKEVAKLVSGTLKMDTIVLLHDNFKAHEDTDSQYLDKIRKMLLAMVEDVRVVLIKLAEHICILRNVKFASLELQRKIALQARDIFAPLANRLGVGHIKWELEDLSLRYLEPQAYQRIAKLLDERRVDREQWIAQVIATLEAALKENGIDAQIDGRVKHINSIWRKMQRKNTGFEEIYDVRAVRIQVKEIRDCYSALGIAHSLWKHIPKEFDDYIATPKENGYRSLHTAVIGPGGKNLEIQIRTFQMHQESELGVAAHWRYKEGVAHDPLYENKIAWLRQLLDWQEDITDGDELIAALRSNVLDERIYVLTPKGDVIDLPKGATPLDFAYHVHTEVGHCCRGAKVNNRIVPLTYQLNTGEYVSILTGPKANPSRDWMNANLGFLATSRARAKVQAWYKQQNREYNMQAGRTIMERELRRLHLPPIDYQKIAAKLNVSTGDDVLCGVGTGDIKPMHVINTANPNVHATLQKTKAEVLPISQGAKKSVNELAEHDVIIDGVGDLLTQIARCCKPVPGDAIIGYITQGRGVTIHRQDCNNLMRLAEQRHERLIQVDWGTRKSKTYPIDITISAYDRHNLIHDITTLLAHEHINVRHFHTQTNRMEHTAHINLTIDIPDLDKLTRLMERLNQLPNVVDVARKL